MRRSLLAAIFAVVLLAAFPGGASAHAVLVGTAPELGGVTARSPGQIVLRFSEPVEPRLSSMTISRPTGEIADVLGAPSEQEARNTLTVPVARRLDDGWWRVRWHSVSADGHPLGGTFLLGVGRAGARPDGVATVDGNAATDPPVIVARWVALVMLMLASGLVGFRVLVVRQAIAARSAATLDAVALAALGGALAAVVAYLGLATARFGERSITDMAFVATTARSSAFGRSYLALAVLLAVAAAFFPLVVRGRGLVRSVAIAVVGVACLAAVAAPGIGGHPGRSAQPAFAVTLDWLHLGGAAVWAGGLLGLTLVGTTVPRAQRRATLGLLVRRFAPFALGALLVIAWTGALSALENVREPARLLSTGYGLAIVIKSLLLLVVLPLAAINRFRFQPALEGDGGDRAVLFLRRLVGGELVVVVVIVAVAAILTSLAPPERLVAGATAAGAPTPTQAAEPPTAPPASATEPDDPPEVPPKVVSIGPGKVRAVIARGGPYAVKLNLDPNRAGGPNRLSLDLTRDGAPVTRASVGMQFTHRDMPSMEPTRLFLGERPVGTYSTETDAIAMGGSWDVLLVIVLKDSTRQEFNFRLTTTA